jgi:uncharacterized protein with PIN domain
MIDIDGSQHSGSGTIVRQSIAFSALTGQAIHIRNARIRRDKPGLRRQHVRVVQAIAELVNGTAEGLQEGSCELMFRPGRPTGGRRYHWDIGSAGSTTMLALAVLPVLAFACQPTSVQIRGGLFQDFAPSFFHLQYVMLPLFKRMGIEADMRMDRPGYAPRGEGDISLHVTPVAHSLRHQVLEGRGISSPPAFLADAMLGRLARWLRMLGYDTAYEKTISDQALIERARAEGRWVLTRDRYLAKRKLLRGRHTLVRSDHIADQLRQLGRELHINLAVGLTSAGRCPACNGILESIRREEAAPSVPLFVATHHSRFSRCVGCGRIYWRGTHWENFQRQLVEVLQT